jgi:type VI secretion system secreted protein VgrG
MSGANREQAGGVTMAFSVSGQAPETFQVASFSGEEALNEDYLFRISLVSPEEGLRPEALLGREATFTLTSRREGPPVSVSYHGVVGLFRVGHQVLPRTFYEATLVPGISRLDLSCYSEVYTSEKGIPGLIEEVLKEAGLTSRDYLFRTGDSYRPRSFVCQYRESLRSFVSRWTEREGIVTYFDHEGEKERIVFTDQPHQKPSWNRTLVYRPPGDPDIGFSDESLHEWTETRNRVPGRVVVQDFNYRKAALEIREEVAVVAGGRETLEIFGENLRTNAEAKRQATLLSEMVRCRERVLSGKATATGIRAGTTVHVARHFRPEMNGAFFVTRVRHEGSQAAFLLTGTTPGGGEGGQSHFQSHFEAIPADIPFRPERRTPWPRIDGVVEAVVEAEGSGKFAELNEYGEYKVRFYFALTRKKSQKGSGWVRLSTPLAGSDNGIHFPLRKETEVAVAFWGGDPDQPVIVGALSNSEGRNLISNLNPEKNMIRSAGGHFLMLNDGNL